MLCRASEHGDVQGILNIVAENFPDMNCVNISTALHKLARLIKEDGGATSAIVAAGDLRLKALHGAARAELERQHATATRNEALPRCWATIAWAYGSLQISDPDISAAFQAIGELAIPCIANFKALELTNLLWAFAKMQVSNKGLFQAARKHILSHLSSFSPSHISTLVWVFVTAQQFQANMLHVLAQEFADRLRTSKVNPVELANLMWGLATAKVHPKAHILHDVGCRAQMLLPEFKLQELSITTWAFSRLGARHDRLFVAAASHLCASPVLMQQIHPQGIANLLWAFEKQKAMGSLASEHIALALQALIPKCLQLVDQLKPQEFTCVCRALTKLGIHLGASPDADKLFTSAARVGVHILGALSVTQCTDLLEAFAGFLHGSSLEAQAQGDVFARFVEALLSTSMAKVNELEALSACHTVAVMAVLADHLKDSRELFASALAQLALWLTVECFSTVGQQQLAMLCGLSPYETDLQSLQTALAALAMKRPEAANMFPGLAAGTAPASQWQSGSNQWPDGMHDRDSSMQHAYSSMTADSQGSARADADATADFMAILGRVAQQQVQMSAQGGPPPPPAHPAILGSPAPAPAPTGQGLRASAPSFEMSPGQIQHIMESNTGSFSHSGLDAPATILPSVPLSNPPPNQPPDPPANPHPNPPPDVSRGPSPFGAEEFHSGMQADFGRGLSVFQQEPAPTYRANSTFSAFNDLEGSTAWKATGPSESQQPVPQAANELVTPKPSISLFSGKDEAKRLLSTALGNLQTVQVDAFGERQQQEFKIDADANHTRPAFEFGDSSSTLASVFETAAEPTSESMPQSSFSRHLDANNFMTDDLWEDELPGTDEAPLPPPRKFMYEGRQFPLGMAQQPLGSIPESEKPEIISIPQDETSPQLYVKKTFIEVAGETSGGPGIAAMTALFRSEPQMSRSREWKVEDNLAPTKLAPTVEEVAPQEPATVTPQESLASAQARRLVLQAVKRKKPVARAPTDYILDSPQEVDELDVLPRGEPERGIATGIFQVQQEFPGQQSDSLDPWCPVNDFADPTSSGHAAEEPVHVSRPNEIALGSDTRLSAGRFFTSTGDGTASMDKVGAKEQSMRLMKALHGRRTAPADQGGDQAQDNEEPLRPDEPVYIVPSSRDAPAPQTIRIDNSDIPQRLRSEAFWSV